MISLTSFTITAAESIAGRAYLNVPITSFFWAERIVEDIADSAPGSRIWFVMAWADGEVLRSSMRFERGGRRRLVTHVRELLAFNAGRARPANMPAETYERILGEQGPAQRRQALKLLEGGHELGDALDGGHKAGEGMEVYASC